MSTRGAKGGEAFIPNYRKRNNMPSALAKFSSEGGPDISETLKTSDEAEEMLRFDLEKRWETISVSLPREATEELNEFAVAESLRGKLVEEQGHLIALVPRARHRSPHFPASLGRLDHG
jgi:hypothetical protein